MKKQKEIKSFVGITLFFWASVLFAEPPDTLWTRTYGWSYSSDGGHSVRQTSDGGYIIAGSTWSWGPNLMDFWLLKTNINGDTIWTKTFGGPDYDDARAVQQTFDGGYIVAGTSGTSSYLKLYLIKTDANGNTIWTKIYEEGFAYSIQQTQDSGYIITEGQERGTGRYLALKNRCKWRYHLDKDLWWTLRRWWLGNSTNF